MTDHNHTKNEDLIGLLPAGGEASRVYPLPCSKELFPIGYFSAEKRKNNPPKVISHYLLEKMRHAGAKKAYFILRPGKWDIPAFFGDGKMLEMHIGYLIMDVPFGVPFTLDQAYPFIQNARVVFGVPDIIFEPHDAFLQLLSKQQQTGADIVLGLFEARNPQKMDMVELDDQGTICNINIKPDSTRLRYTWIIAVWNFRFTEFMHQYVVAYNKQNTVENEDRSGHKEIYVGDVIQAAILTDIKIEKVVFDGHPYIDIGTPDDLAKAVHRGIGPQEEFE